MLNVFKHFHVSIKREIERQLKYIRANNGSEYRDLFEKCCRNHGIKLEKIILKISQYNRVAKSLFIKEFDICFLMLNCLNHFRIKR